MTGATRPIAACDAGPVIHLAEISAQRAFAVFGKVLVPRLVADELGQTSARPGLSTLARRPFEIVDLTGTDKGNVERLGLTLDLPPADAAVLVLANKRRAGLVLTDDLEVRDAARTRRLRPVGSIGILLRAAATGVVPPKTAHQLLDALLEVSSLYVTPTLIREAHAALTKHVA